MDIISIIAGILLPIAGWVIGRFFTLEKNDSKLAAAVDNLTISKRMIVNWRRQSIT